MKILLRIILIDMLIFQIVFSLVILWTSHLDSLISIIEPEMPQQFQRWGWKYSAMARQCSGSLEILS